MIFATLLLQAALLVPVTLEWDAYTDVADYLLMERCTITATVSCSPRSTRWVSIAKLAITETVHTDQAETGATYKYRITAFRGDQKSHSNVVEIEVPQTPITGFTANVKEEPPQ